jgi:hypothetical protein
MNFKKVLNCTHNSLYNVKGEKHDQCIRALSTKSASNNIIKKKKVNRFNINSVPRFSNIINCTYNIIIIYNLVISYIILL